MLDRRAFIARAGLGAVALAVPPFEPLRPLKVRREGVALGAMRPFSVLHVSDSHIARIDSRDGAELHGFASARSRIGRELGEYYLGEAVHYARRGEMPLVHTGDFMDFMSAANLEYAARRLRTDDYVACVGNHEFWAGADHPEVEDYKLRTLASLKGRWDGLPASVRKICGVNFFAFDDAFGRVTEEIADAFERTVAEGLPIVMACHVPLCADASWPFARWSCGARPDDPLSRAFVRRVQAEPLVRAVLAGHLHGFKKLRFSETAVELVAGALFDGDCTRVDFC